MADSRMLWFPLAALAVVGLLIVLAPERDEQDERPVVVEHLPDELPAPAAHELAFVNDLHVAEPPEWALRRRIVEDPVERALLRLQWAPLEVLNRTDAELAQLDAAARERFVESFEPAWRANPAAMAPHLPRLALLGTPSAERIVLEGALDGSGYVRKQAARALLELDTPGAARRAEQLLEDPDESVRREALRALTEMDEPEADRILLEYAAKRPEEGVRHVLARLAARTEDPAAAIPVLREYVDEPGELGELALSGLAQFGDLGAIDRSHAMLSQPGNRTKIRALGHLALAPADVVDLERVFPVLRDPTAEVRREAAEFLAQRAKEPLPGEAPRIAAVLEAATSADGDQRVRDAARKGLFRLGRKDLAEPLLKAVAEAGGADFAAAVDMTAREFRDERVMPILLRRLEEGLSPDDAAIALNGLAELGDAAAARPFLEALRSAGPGEQVDTAGIPLSYRAVLLLPRLGASLVPEVRRIVEERPRTPVLVRALDALRGFSEHTGEEDLEVVIDALFDEDLPLEARLAAADTLPYVRAPDAHERIVERLDEIEDRELAQRLLRVMQEYL